MEKKLCGTAGESSILSKWVTPWSLESYVSHQTISSTVTVAFCSSSIESFKNSRDSEWFETVSAKFKSTTPVSSFELEDTFISFL